MLEDITSATPEVSNEREIRRQAILAALHVDAEAILGRMADRLADLADDKAFGQVEYDLRDLGHELAACAHKTGLDAGKKRATQVRVWSAPTAKPTRVSSNTAPSRG